MSCSQKILQFHTYFQLSTKVMGERVYGIRQKKVRLGELLVNSGVLTNEQLQQALDNPARQGKKLGEFLVDEGIVSEDDLAKALSRQLDLDMIDLQSTNVDKEVLNLVPVNVLKKNKIFPSPTRKITSTFSWSPWRIPGLQRHR